TASSTREVGGKCASLGELIGAGLAVPPGFAVTTASHGLFLESSEVRAREAELLASVDYESLPAVTAVSQELRSLVEGSELPPSAAGAIRDAYGELCGDAGSVAVAVRSSAVSEDMAGASFAGQLETYLWVEGADAVVEHVRRCWGGFFTPEALTYRHRQQIVSEDALMSVGVQRMVRARSAGVMFTLNPINGDRSKVVIESTWGLGEPLVAGEVDPDRFVVDKVMLEVLEKSISPHWARPSSVTTAVRRTLSGRSTPTAARCSCSRRGPRQSGVAANASPPSRKRAARWNTSSPICCVAEQGAS